jgi:hypothetical protein
VTEHPIVAVIVDHDGRYAITWHEDDGGRAASGFKGQAGDCVTRAIAIATQVPYRDVYTEMALGQARRGKPRSARQGVHKTVYKPYLETTLGWEWHATMSIGSGCRVHLREIELPMGRIIVRLSGHLAAVVDGVLHDTHDCSRGGTRCVYGFWSAPTGSPETNPAAGETATTPKGNP